MVDTETLILITSAGYALSSDETGGYWLVKEHIKTGPFRTIADAVAEAQAEIEINAAYRFWKKGEEK